jgi:guanylate kinase
MIIIIGCAGAGKSTIEKALVLEGYERITSYTSRPIRCNEENHVDYHFITDEEFEEKFNNGFFAEHTKYNGWYYGVAKEDCNDLAIAVVEPYGFRQLKAKSDLDVFSIFIDVPERVRLVRMVNRGDNLMEVFRRIFSDQGVFQGIEDEVDCVIGNDRPLVDTLLEIKETLRRENR